MFAAALLSSVRIANAQPAPDPAIEKLVPQDVRDRGELRIGTDATYPPFESIDPKSGAIVGLDADLGRDLAGLMGLRVRLVNLPLDGLIPSVADGAVDLGLSSLGDTRERERVVDFVTYYWNETGVLVSAGDPKRLDVRHLCAARIGVQRGSLQQTTILPELTRACAGRAGRPQARVFNSTPAAVLALRSGRIDAVLNDAPANAYAARLAMGSLAVVGPALRNRDPGGVAVWKASGLTPAVLAGVEALIASGVYAAALKKWGLTEIAITRPTVNWAGR